MRFLGNIHILAAISRLSAGVGAERGIRGAGVLDIDGLDCIAKAIIKVFDLRNRLSRKCVGIAGIEACIVLRLQIRIRDPSAEAIGYSFPSIRGSAPDRKL